MAATVTDPIEVGRLRTASRDLTPSYAQRSSSQRLRDLQFWLGAVCANARPSLRKYCSIELRRVADAANRTDLRDGAAAADNLRLFVSETTAEVARGTVSPVAAMLFVTSARRVIGGLERSQNANRNPAPVMPIVERDFCPNEGCSFGEWMACQSLTAHTTESAGSPVVFRLKRSMLFRAVTGNLHVTRPGLIVFRDTVRVADEDILGADTLVFTPADSLYPLFYGSEGFGNWYFHGKRGGGPWFIPDDHTFYERRKGVVQLRRAVTHWWIRARNSAGLEGWIDLGSMDYPPFAQVEGMQPGDVDPPLRCLERR